MPAGPDARGLHARRQPRQPSCQPVRPDPTGHVERPARRHGTAQPNVQTHAGVPGAVELQGTWAAVSEAGDDLELEIREAGYTMSLLRDLGPETSSGRVVVVDDEIVFSNSNLCVGDGRYRWSIDGGVLRFEPIAPDACPGRADGLEDIDYTRGE